jgi:hypothetical protein
MLVMGFIRSFALTVGFFNASNRQEAVVSLNSKNSILRKFFEKLAQKKLLFESNERALS